jgi:SAM-dependent methyltransferase
MTVTTCRVCGSAALRLFPALWDALIAQWQLAPAEVDYLNRQQGLSCADCGATLRTMALAASIGRCIGHGGPLTGLAELARARDLRVLQINKILGLDGVLATLPRHRLASYPAIDLGALDFPDAAFDLIVHSDTLEHVAQPRHALAECRRVLAPGGACCFTVPVVVGRMSRSRAGLPRSYHGAPGIELDDFLVHTEFGADVWAYALEAGFSACELVALEYPGGLAIRAQR